MHFERATNSGQVVKTVIIHMVPIMNIREDIMSSLCSDAGESVSNVALFRDNKGA